MRIDQKQGINDSASWAKLRLHIAAFTHFEMPISLTNCKKCWKTMKYCLFVCTERLQ